VVWEFVSGGIIAAAYAISSPNTERWITEQCQTLLKSNLLSRILIGLAGTILVAGSLLSKVTITLPVNHGDVVINGNKVTDLDPVTSYGLSFST
jgi:hypothetical protein